MPFPPSKYSPEYEKPQKPGNNAGCCMGGCGKPDPPPPPAPKVGCSVKYKSTCNVRYAGGSRTITWKSC